ncbi:ataxin-3-like isoform X2 [Branchiostoma lanceolatum]|uniref:ataxin-3-like isoform X2 n=1 Tax=Branchiostoma lanceolatum TaxID=7740 RepID=UPI003452356B
MIASKVCFRTDVPWIIKFQQEGSLCAQHCLNALLQGEYFTAVDLASFAQQLDEAERERMAEGGTTTAEYQHFLQQPSSNMDDSGFFSIQVISRALEVWCLRLVPITSQEYLETSEHPTQEQAFICNFREHWLSIRKLGYQWFNLNSLLIGPELISDTYLSLFLAQLQQEGYSIYSVRGTVPECEADGILRITPAVQLERPKLISEVNKQREKDEGRSSDASTGGQSSQEDDPDLAEALRISRQENEMDDKSLQEALRLSMQGYLENNPQQGQDHTPESSGAIGSVPPSHTTQQTPSHPTKAPDPVDLDELRRRRQAFFERQQTDPESPDKRPPAEPAQDRPDPVENDVSPVDSLPDEDSSREEPAVSEMTEDEMLQAALKMSMEATQDTDQTQDTNSTS